MTDTLPAGLAFKSIVSPPAATYDAAANAVKWTGDVPAYASQTIQFIATVQPVSDGTVISNYAQANNGSGHVITLGPASTVIDFADLGTSTKTVDKSDASPGESLAYTVSVHNTGVYIASNAMVTDTLPADVSFVSATGGATFDPALNAILWHGSVAPAATSDFSYQVLIDKPLPAGTVITNTAQVGDGLGKTWWTD